MSEVLQHLGGGSRTPAALEVQGGKVISTIIVLQNQAAQTHGLGEGKTLEGEMSTGTRADPHSNPAPQSHKFLCHPPPLQLLPLFPGFHLQSACQKSPSLSLPQGLCNSTGYQSLWVPPPHSYLPPPSCPQSSLANAVSLQLQLWVFFFVPESLPLLILGASVLLLCCLFPSPGAYLSLSPSLHIS